jgi:hypothetical protein
VFVHPFFSATPVRLGFARTKEGGNAVVILEGPVSEVGGILRAIVTKNVLEMLTEDLRYRITERACCGQCWAKGSLHDRSESPWSVPQSL